MGLVSTNANPLVTIYKENMSEEIEELRDQIGGKLDIFILTRSSSHKQFSTIIHIKLNLKVVIKLCKRSSVGLEKYLIGLRMTEKGKKKCLASKKSEQCRKKNLKLHL